MGPEAAEPEAEKPDTKGTSDDRVDGRADDSED